MQRMPALVCARITGGLCALVPSPSLVPGTLKSSVLHFSFYLDLGCDGSEICLLSLGFSGEHSPPKVTRWSRWSPISCPWWLDYNAPVMILVLLAVFLLTQLRVQLTFAARLNGCFLVNLLFTRTSRSFPAKPLSISSLSSCTRLSMPAAGLCP